MLTETTTIDLIYNTMTKNSLEMLTSREQLMYDIDAICDEFFCENFPASTDKYEELVSVLCDAVCRNFPNQTNS